MNFQPFVIDVSVIRGLLTMTRNIQTVRYDILADYLINLNCNYACDYCPQARTGSHNKSLSGHTNIEAISDFFDNTNLKWLIHMSGGEPSLHPEFVSLCKLLTTNHYISINSNIVSNAIAVFANVINPERVAFVHASVHYAELKKKHAVSEFIRSIALLKNAGFHAYVTQVFFPPMIREFAEIISFFSNNDIIVHPKIFRGFYGGRLYPQEYSEDERRLFMKFSRQASKLDVTPYTHIDPDYDLESLSGFLSFRGLPCLAGNRYVHIDYEGNIHRCYRANNAIGNIFDNKFTRLPPDEVCPFRACPCSYYGLEYAKGQPKTVKIGPMQKRLIQMKSRLNTHFNR
jgi:MoaA/NifB/PqqE/SkfB family radical SAM enzyme